MFSVSSARQLTTPNATVSAQTRQIIIAGWAACLLLYWANSTAVFLPTPWLVWNSLIFLWQYQGLAQAVLASVLLNAEAIALASLLALSLAALSVVPLIRPVAEAMAKLRFLSLAGIGFAFTLLVRSESTLKLYVLAFMILTFFVVSMLDVVQAIPQESYDLATTLRMGPWETLWEVVVLGQVDQALVVLRQTAAMSIMFLATAEGMAMSEGGLGTLLNTASRHNNFAAIMTIQMIVLAIGLVQDYGIAWARVSFCPWVKGRD